MGPVQLRGAGPAWLRQAERGSAAAMRLMVRTAILTGRSLSRLFLYPICAYYLLFSPKARRASRSYLQRTLDRKPGLADGFRHYLTFATTIHDRIYFLTGRHRQFQIEVSVPDEVRKIFSRKQGCIALGAHMGSFEVMRVQADLDRVPPVNVLMYLDNAPRILSVLRSISPGFENRVIPLGRPGSLLRARECLDRGEVVGMLADRALHHDKTVSCAFLGGSARFPLAPMLLASLLEAPVFLFFGLYLGGRRYQLVLEPFAERITLDPANREGSLRPWVERFSARVEHHCLRAPFNWFNFYEFWSKPDH